MKREPPRAIADHLTIAIASDLHAHDGSATPDQRPSHYSTADPEDTAHHPISGLLKLIEDESLIADLLLCPGDLGDKAKPQSTAHAWHSLQRIGEALRVEMLAATAGNHDVDSRYNYNDYDAKGWLQCLDPLFPIAPDELYDRYWSRHFAVVRFEDICLVLLNSSAYHGGPSDEYEHGRISTRTLTALRDAVSSGLSRINILLCHHHPHHHSELGLGEADLMKNGQLTERMQERMKRGSKMPGWTHISEFDWFSTLADYEA